MNAHDNIKKQYIDRMDELDKKSSIHSVGSTWIGDAIGWPGSGKPSDPLPWKGLPRSPQSPWADLDAIKKEMERQERERMRERDLMDKMAALGYGQRQSEAEKMEKAGKWALQIESAASLGGARHALREVLSMGYKPGLIRCWAVVVERGFDKEILSTGQSETLMAAAAGADSSAALAWLASEGFEPGARLACMALLMVLSSGSGQSASLGSKTLIDAFGAGTLDAEALAKLSRQDKSLASKARANAEAYELSESAKAPRAGKPAGPARL